MKLLTTTCAVLFCALTLTVRADNPTVVAPLHPEKWNEVENYIRNNWLKYVDTVPELPRPYCFALNPGTLYYWDLYFINEGLMRQGFMEQARNNVENFIYQVEKIGLIPNAHGWGEDRSQTPYFGMMVRNYFERTDRKDTAWLRTAYRAVLKEYEFWTNTHGNTIEDHSTPVQGLQRFSHHSDTTSLVKFYDRVLAGRFRLSKEVPVAEKIRVAGHRLAEAETMDFTPRFEGRCMDFIPVDLNANLYQYEKNLAYFEKVLGISNGKLWEKKAKRRAELINQYLWNEERGLYMDYDFINRRHTSIAAVTTLMPLYWSFAPKARAERVCANLPLFDSEGGVVVCEHSEQPILYQWGDGAVWAPIQFITMGALANYGYREAARNVAVKWLNTVTSNFIQPDPATYPPFKYGDGRRHPGFLYEKYTRSGKINDSEYPCSEMIAWSASTFLRALELARQ